MSKLQKIVLSIMSITLIGLIIGVMLIPNGSDTPKVGFVKPEMDACAVDGVPQNVPSELAYQTAEFTKNFKIAMCGNLKASKDNTADLYLTSFDTNEGYVRVVLYDENNNELGTTGLIKPGQYIKSIKLNTAPNEDKIVNAKVLSYDMDTYVSLGAVNVKLHLSV